MNYKNYTVQDFVSDKYFREWVLQPNRESEQFWNEWMIENQSRSKLAISARNILLHLAFEEHTLSEDEVINLWDNIETRIDAPTEDSFRKTNQRYLLPQGAQLVFKSRFTLLKVAASFTFLASLIGVLAYIIFSLSYLNKVEIATNFGELKTVNLPDGSVVELNANTSISYNDDWDNVSEREIWIEGEAYFDVVHTEQHTPFKVYANGLEVRVLGTEFNVYGRGKITKVVLEEGQVKLNSAAHEQSILLAPGDLVTYNTKNLSLNKTKVDTKLHTSWKDHRLLFRQTTLEDLSYIMKENYDLDFFFIDANLAKEEFTGVIPTDNIDILIASLSEAFNIDVEVKGQALILRRNK